MVKLNKVLKDRENRIYIIISVLVILIASLPLMNRYCIQGHDSAYHLLRIEALKEGIKMGRPFLKVNALFFGGAGYASSMFYPDFILYIPALLRCVGLSINASYHIFIFICIILTFVSGFIAAKGISKNKFCGVICGILVTLFNYHLDDIYIRSAVGEFVAFIFLPLVIYGFYNLIYENMNKPYILIGSLSAVIITHTISTVFCIIIGVFMCLINYKKVFNKVTLIRLFLSAVVTFLLTASYTLPMLEQFKNTRFNISNPWSDAAFEARNVYEVFSNEFPNLGVIVLIFILLRIFNEKIKADKVFEFCDMLMLISIILVFISTNLFPWDRMGKYLSFLQFPWRVNIIITVLVAISGAVAVYKFSNQHNISRDLALFFVTSVCAIVAVSGYTDTDIEYYDYSNDYYDYKPFTADTIGGEWLPDTVTDRDSVTAASEYAVGYKGDSFETIEIERFKTDLSVEIKKDYEFVDVPFIYYLGYAAESEDGEKINLDGSGKNGFVRIYPEGKSGKVKVFYKGTILQNISMVLTLIGIFVSIGGIVYHIIKKKHR